MTIKEIKEIEVKHALGQRNWIEISPEDMFDWSSKEIRWVWARRCCSICGKVEVYLEDLFTDGKMTFHWVEVDNWDGIEKVHQKIGYKQ